MQGEDNWVMHGTPFLAGAPPPSAPGTEGRERALLEEVEEQEGGVEGSEA